MATRTSVGSGAWSAAGTWDTAVPVDGDDVVIASGHTVTFDVDQSAFTTGVGITITGTLNHTTTTGTYCLFAKTGASIVGAGTWNIGTSGTPIPFAAKHTITGAAGWYVDGNAGLTMTVYGAEPSIKYVKLSGAEEIGQTELSIDTDVTGDIWAAGDIIRINDINNAKESEERVIAAGGIAAGAITVTAGLTEAKSTGAIICLITRNVKVIGNSTGKTIYRVGNTANKLTIGGGMFYGYASKWFFELCHYAEVSGGTFSISYYVFYNTNYYTVSGGVFSGNDYALRNSADVKVTGGLFVGNTAVLNNCNPLLVTDGLFSGNGTVISGASPLSVTGGVFSGNGTVVSSTNLVISGGTLTSNANDLYSSTGTLHNTALTGTVEHNNYTAMYYFWLNCQSIEHDGIAGAFKAWCKGGVVTSQTSVKPDGYVQAYLLDPESATYPVFFTKQFSVEPGKTVNIEVQLRKDASMTYLPRAYLMASIGNPLAGATPVDSFTMTNSVDTWETDTFSIENTTDYDQDYTLYFVAQNATDNAYAAYDITTAGGSGGGGAVRIIG